MKIQMRRLSCFAACLVTLIGTAVLPGSAAADPIPWSGPPSPTATLVDFNTIPPGAPITTQYQSLGVTFSGGLFGGFALTNFGKAQNFIPFTAAPSDITIDFASAMWRVSFDVSSGDLDNLQVEVFAFSGDTLVLTFNTGVAGPAGIFAGIEDDEGINSIDRLVLRGVGGGTRGFVMDNLRFEANVIPEPSGALLFGTGLLLAGSGIRRRKARR